MDWSCKPSASPLLGREGDFSALAQELATDSPQSFQQRPLQYGKQQLSVKSNQALQNGAHLESQEGLQIRRSSSSGGVMEILISLAPTREAYCPAALRPLSPPSSQHFLSASLSPVFQLLLVPVPATSTQGRILSNRTSSKGSIWGLPRGRMPCGSSS
eukprot:jgi/Botrbrau1/18682/Bobra.0386s0010.1